MVAGDQGGQGGGSLTQRYTVQPGQPVQGRLIGGSRVYPCVDAASSTRSASASASSGGESSVTRRTPVRPGTAQPCRSEHRSLGRCAGGPPRRDQLRRSERQIRECREDLLRTGFTPGTLPDLPSGLAWLDTLSLQDWEARVSNGTNSEEGESE